MDEMAIAIIAGILPLLFLTQLPGWEANCILLILASLLWIKRRKTYQLFALMLISFLWAIWSGSTLLEQINTLTSGRQVIIAEVKSIYLKNSDAQNVVLQLSLVNGQWWFPPVSVSVKWDVSVLGAFCAGQRWLLTVHLKPVHSRLNQGGFDHQRWAIANRQLLTGKIVFAKNINNTCSLRQKLISYIHLQLDNRFIYQPILLALAFGERRWLDKREHLILQQTGTAHLMAISGLHVAIASLFGWLLARALQFFFPAAWIGHRFPLLSGWLVAMTYAWLAGFHPPVLRAALALTIWMSLRAFALFCSAWQVWLWTICLILISDPLTVLSDSFWLSCLAVCALIFWFQWVPLPPCFRFSWHWGILRWLHLQFGMLLLLMPLQVGLFHGWNFASLPANLWAVPIVSFCTVPLVLLALMLCVVPTVALFFWSLADFSLMVVFIPLELLKTGWITLGETSLLISYSGWITVTIWRFRWWRYYPGTLMVICLVMLVSARRVDRFFWRVDMLDVGHGLAVMIERNGRGIIFDTGDRWNTGSMASSVILPYINWRGLTIELIIASHDHRDHTGGVSELKAAFPEALIRSSFPHSGHLPCQQGNKWQWQGLNFEVLWPPGLVNNASNNDSCVIRIDDGKYSLLLTGDLEAKAELMLVKTERAKLKSTVLQIPHHGSKTSSTPPFIRAVDPELAMASVSRYNPWHLPAKSIIERYQKNRIPWRDTSYSGQLSLCFFKHHWTISGFREQLMPRWYHQWFGGKTHNE